MNTGMQDAFNLAWKLALMSRIWLIWRSCLCRPDSVFCFEELLEVLGEGGG